MGLACLACLSCAECGHAWRAPLPFAPRLARASAIGAPLMIGGAVHIPANLAALWVVGVGVAVALLAFRLCTPPCPACRSERTLRRRDFDLRRDARVIEGDADDIGDAGPRDRRARFG